MLLTIIREEAPIHHRPIAGKVVLRHMTQAVAIKDTIAGSHTLVLPHEMVEDIAAHLVEINDMSVTKTAVAYGAQGVAGIGMIETRQINIALTAIKSLLSPASSVAHQGTSPTHALRAHQVTRRFKSSVSAVAKWATRRTRAVPILDDLILSRT